MKLYAHNDKNYKIKKILIETNNYRFADGKHVFLSGDRKPSQTSGKSLLSKIQDFIKKEVNYIIF